MNKIGITGGVGAGKSTVLRLLKDMCNCEIIMADDVAKELMKKGNVLSEKAYELFGEKAYDDNNILNRNYIAEVVYNNPVIMKKWENIVHPATNKQIMYLIEKSQNENKDFVFIESALLIENGYNKICDEIWYVYADESTRRIRLKLDREYTDEKITKIYSGQMSDMDFRKNCNFIIDTSNSIEITKKQLEFKLEEYKVL